MSKKILHILPVSHHGSRSPEDSLLPVDEAAGEDIFQVDRKRQCQDHGEKLLKEDNRPEPAHAADKLPRPDALAESHRKSSRCQPQKRGEQDGMEISLFSREAHEKAAPRATFLPASICRLLQIRHLFLHFLTLF